VNDNVRVVYSTDGGAVERCPSCGRPPATCRCVAQPKRPPSKAHQSLPQDGTVRVWRDSRRRRGKTVTVIAGLPGGAQLAEIAGQLKRHCGSGGTVQDDGTVEVQGDHRERVADKLRTLGYRVKLAGG
jgi:translation initiation factor 1